MTTSPPSLLPEGAVASLMWGSNACRSSSNARQLNLRRAPHQELKLKEEMYIIMLK
jgi:hypothetical protein